MLKEYKTVYEISGPLMMVEGVENAKYGHIVDIELGDGSMRHGQILQVEGDKVMVQVFEGTSGINISQTTVRFLGKPMELGVSPDILGLLEEPGPKFSKSYGQVGEAMLQAFSGYCDEVQAGKFPDDEHSYHMKKGELERLKELLKK